jgi:hypothetical protein
VVMIISSALFDRSEQRCEIAKSSAASFYPPSAIFQRRG